MITVVFKAKLNNFYYFMEKSCFSLEMVKFLYLKLLHQLQNKWHHDDHQSWAHLWTLADHFFMKLGQQICSWTIYLTNILYNLEDCVLNIGFFWFTNLLQSIKNTWRKHLKKQCLMYINIIDITDFAVVCELIKNKKLHTLRTMFFYFKQRLPFNIPSGKVAFWKAKR